MLVRNTSSFKHCYTRQFITTYLSGLWFNSANSVLCRTSQWVKVAHVNFLLLQSNGHISASRIIFNFYPWGLKSKCMDLLTHPVLNIRQVPGIMKMSDTNNEG